MTTDSPLSALLVEILARVDGLFCNLREYRRGSPFLSQKALVAIDERRGTYLGGGGIALASGGSATDRKQAEREFDSLADMGLIAKHTQSGRRVTVSLTHHGEFVARSISATWDIASKWCVLEKLAALTDSPIAMEYGGILWAREFDLADEQKPDEKPGTRLAVAEMATAPHKVRGWIVDGVDCEGRVCYSITTDGRTALANGAPEIPEDLPGMDEPLADWYSDALAEYANERATWKPETPNRLYIPLPVSFPARRVATHATT